jgi:hypothetical protein
MYYFEILDILENEDNLTSYEIYLRILKKNTSANQHNVNLVLSKMYLKNNNVDRKEVSMFNSENQFLGKQYVYFLR